MNPNCYRLPLILAGVLGLIAVVRLAAWPIVRITLPLAESQIRTSGRPENPKIASESVAAIASRDPFRVGRRPALPAYDPLRLAEQLAPPPPRPALFVVGILDGKNPSAVVEGLPGVEGPRVLRVGDVVAGLRIKQIGSGRVTIAGMDTTWILEVRQPWKQ